MFDRVYDNRRVLVTGDTGFKGSWLTQWLLRLGADVRGCGLAPPTSPSLYETLNLQDHAPHNNIDIRNAEAVSACLKQSQPEIVFHLAAQPLVRLSYTDPKSTFDINVGGTVNLLEAVRNTPSVQAVVIVTSDKCYENREWLWGYREDEAMGGHDPYSASKGAAELVAASYRRSFFADQEISVATARAGNVIGGGDWAEDRILTDFVSGIVEDRPLMLRYPEAVRPWQHVCEPLSGYLTLGAKLLQSDGHRYAQAWNFGPSTTSHTTVHELARLLVSAWGKGRIDLSQSQTQHEAKLLQLDCSKAHVKLNWRGLWDVETTVRHTVDWYQAFYEHKERSAAAELAHRQLSQYESDAVNSGLAWSSSPAKPRLAA